MATLAREDDSALVSAAVDKALFTAAEGDEAVRAARAAGRPVSDVLVERGLLAPRTVESLRAEVASGAATVRTPPPPAGARGLQVPGRLGDYEVLQKLGEGGMGAVYRARQLNLDREVALKVVSAHVAVEPGYAERFVREARAAAKVSHPHVITIFDAGQVDGQLLMALELMRGGDAAQLAKKAGGRLPEARALQVVRDCARGLQALEKAGLVHRDIKPANVFIGEDGGAKLADLGLARSRAGDDRMTNSGVIVGTPAYMAPEQADGSPDLDVRTDIYALGATLYHLVTGEPPYTGASPLVVVSKVLTAPVPDPRALRPDLSEATAAVIRRALAKHRTERFQTATELVVALERARTALGAGARQAARPVGAPASARLARPGTVVAPSAPRSSPVPLAGAVIGAVLLTFIGSAAALLRRDPPPATPPAPAERPIAARVDEPIAAPVDEPVRPLPERPAATSARPQVSAAPAGVDLRVARSGVDRVDSNGEGWHFVGKGQGSWPRASFVSTSPITLPARVRFEVKHPKISRSVVALDDQGFTDPAGFFYELGVKLDPADVTAGVDLRRALWLSLAASERSILCLMRAVDGRDRATLPLAGAPGLRVVPAGHEAAGGTFASTAGVVYRVDLTLRSAGWTCVVEAPPWSKQRSKRFEGVWADLGLDEAPRAVHVFAHAGSWSSGAGEGMFKVDAQPLTDAE